MNDKCDSMMELYFSLDNHSRLPLRLSMHLLTCKKCRSEVRSMTLADKACKHPLSDPDAIGLKSSILKVMQKIDPEFEKKQQRNPITFAIWIISFIAFIICVLCLSIFKPHAMSRNLALIFYSLVGLAVVIFCIFFIYSNMGFFIKKIDKKQNEHKQKYQGGEE